MEKFGDLKKDDVLFMYDYKLDTSYEGRVEDMLDNSLFHDGWKSVVVEVIKDGNHVATVEDEEPMDETVNGASFLDYTLYTTKDAMIESIITMLKKRIDICSEKIEKWQKLIT